MEDKTAWTDEEIDEFINHKCLSLNDVLNCSHDDSAGGGILYTHFDALKALVKERIK